MGLGADLDWHGKSHLQGNLIPGASSPQHVAIVNVLSQLPTAVCSACFNTQYICFFSSTCIAVCYMILRINTDYFPKWHNPFFVMETVILEMGVHGSAVG